jgi:hypothetical protein
MSGGGRSQHTLELMAPSFLEHWALKRKLPHHLSTKAGVALRSWRRSPHVAGVIICGLAGSLVPDLGPGSILVPEIACLEDGSTVDCDSEFRGALVTAAHSMGYSVDARPLLTASTVITGGEREIWSSRAFAAADMETALLANTELRIATVRVILDSPSHPISQEWLNPTVALRHPALWRECGWLAWNAPRFALRAAEVVRCSFPDLSRAALA